LQDARLVAFYHAPARRRAAVADALDADPVRPDRPICPIERSIVADRRRFSGKETGGV